MFELRRGWAWSWIAIGARLLWPFRAGALGLGASAIAAAWAAGRIALDIEPRHADVPEPEPLVSPRIETRRVAAHAVEVLRFERGYAPRSGPPDRARVGPRPGELTDINRSAAQMNKQHVLPAPTRSSG